MAVFTKDQNDAILTRGSDLLVSAAAGSGKTAVLVERIIRMLLDPVRPVSVERLLVVTFTEAAAKEMKSRLEKALAAQGKLFPDNRHIQDQLMLLGRADITTIHSFCLSVVRKYFNQAGVDPLFKIADEAEADIIKADVLKDMFEDFYDAGNGKLFETVFGKADNTDFLNLVEAFGDKIKDDSLQQLILRLHRFSQSHPFPDRWLREQADANFIGCVDDIYGMKWYKPFIAEVKEILGLAANAVGEAIELSEGCPYLPDKNVEILYNERKYIAEASAAADEGLESLFAAIPFPFEAFSGGRAKKCKDGTFTDEEISAVRDSVKNIRENFVKKPVKDLEKAFARPFLAFVDDCNVSAGLIRALCLVTVEFAARFDAEKRERNVADFSDFEHLCLKVLIKPESTADNIVLTDAAVELGNKYSEIMVDEYQDSNAVQEMILSSLGADMFMVGDVKQSIYRFRLADPSIFMKKYNRYLAGEGVIAGFIAPANREVEAGAGGGSVIKERNGRLITLSKNFRSRKNVIDSANCLFSALMSPDLGDIEYDERARLYYGADYPPVENNQGKGDVNETELIIVNSIDSVNTSETDEDNGDGDDLSEQDLSGNNADITIADLENAEIEAKAAAYRIRKLVADGFKVTEDGAFRDIKYSDIAILLRSPNATAETFVEELKRLDIPAYSDVSGGYFDTAEVLTALSFLRVIDNPLQDIPLISALHSPVYSFTADELAEIRLINKHSAYYNALTEYAATNNNDLSVKINGFLSSLQKFRDMAAYSGVNAVIWAVYTETGYFNYAGVMEGGAVRQANLIALFTRAVEFERNSKKGLFNFIRYIEKLKDNDNGQNTAKVINENANAVRIMSIHKSKGLEYPVVILCGICKKFNLQDLNASVIMHQNYGLASVAVDTQNRTKSPTLAKYAVAKQIKRESLSEELRVLYVAVTRAREKLIMIGAKKGFDPAKDLPSKLPPKEHMPQYLLAQKGYINWILAAVCPNGEVAGGFRFEIMDAAEMSELGSVSARNYLNLLTKLKEIDPMIDYSGVKGEITDRLSYVYPFRLSEIPAKLSVSEIKRRFDRQLSVDSKPMQPTTVQAGFKKPAFLNENTEKEKDTAITAEVTAEITAAERGVITHTVLEHIPLDILPTEASLDAFLTVLRERGVLGEREIDAVDKRALLAFINSGVFAMMREADEVKRESRFIIGVPPGEISGSYEVYGGSEGEACSEVLVHGIIDCMIIKNGAVTIVDYKTDSLYNKDAVEHARLYRTQMRFYRLAAEKTTGLPVTEVLLYFITAGTVVPVEA